MNNHSTFLHEASRREELNAIRRKSPNKNRKWRKQNYNDPYDAESKFALGRH